MRTSRVHLGLFAVLIALVLVSSASANSVTLTYKGHGIPNHQGYPYLFSINGSSTLTALICDSYDNDVRVGESWQATVTPFLKGIGLFGASDSLDYKAAGLIFKSILDGTISAAAGQWAIWGLFSSNAQSQSQFTLTGAAAVEAQYLALAATAPNSAFNGLLLYTPVAGTQSSGGLPQEFIGISTVPEPGSLVLLGTGLIGLAGVLRRRRTRP